MNNNLSDQKDSLLPPPEILVKYQELGIGEDIIKLVKNEQEHRHTLQNKYQVNYRMGQLFGFLIFIAMIFNSGYLIKSGYVVDAYISLAIFSISMIIISYNIKSGNISKRRTIINKRIRKRNYK